MIDLPPLEAIDGAACIGHDPELWFPVATDGRTRSQVYCNDSTTALRICADCPLSARMTCAKRAVDGMERDGIWAGHDLSNDPHGRTWVRKRLRVIAAGGEYINPPARKPARPVALGSNNRKRPLPIPVQCAGTCGRMLRPTSRSEAEMPNTKPARARGLCKPCFDRDEAKNRVSDDMRRTLASVIHKTTTRRAAS